MLENLAGQEIAFYILRFLTLENIHIICGKDVKSNEFSIIDSCNSEHYLRILESIYIKTRNLDLNDRQFAVPLNII